ncbi:MAG: AAA family ATPase [Patescibacteria group bacterium]|nr:AAA family ATPase [Patescibacteria group bacterium]
MSAPLIILTGPSAAGKTTIAKMLLQKKSLNLKRFVTCTTRPKRKGEVNHKDYHFLSEEDFKKAIKNKEMIEWSKVYGNYYGSRKKDLLNSLSGKNPVLLIVDSQGVKKIKKIIPTCCVIFIDISKKTLLKRLKERASNSNENQTRIDKYEAEKEAMTLADKVINNKDGELSETIKNVATTINFGILLQKKAKKA